MGALSGCVVAAALVAACPDDRASVTRWRPLVAQASQRFGVPVGWIERVMRAESGGRTSLAGRPIVSRVGAMGLMQLMPETWTAMRSSLGLGRDPFDPHDNILAGTAYLRMMRDRFGYPGLFAAYDAGPARYAAYLAGARSLPAETVRYLADVGGTSMPRTLTGSIEAKSASGARAAPAALFLPLSGGAAAATEDAASRSDRLLAIPDRR